MTVRFLSTSLSLYSSLSRHEKSPPPSITPFHVQEGLIPLHVNPTHQNQKHQNIDREIEDHKLISEKERR